MTPTAMGVLPPQDRYPLDLMRALAAFLVVGFHSFQNNQLLGDGFDWPTLADSAVRNTELAVDLFFVISGFVLWLPIAKAGLRGMRQRSPRDMMRRRMVRLIPLYFVTFVVLWAFANPGIEMGWEDLLLHLTFTQIYSDEYIFYTLGPAWSLAVEFHFYLLMALAIPVVAYLTKRAASRAVRALVVLVLPLALIAIGVAYLYWAIYLDPQPLDHWSVWFSAPSKAGAFGLGMLTAVFLAGNWVPRLWLRAIFVLIAVALTVSSVLYRAEISEIERQWLHIALAVTAMLVILSMRPRRGPRSTRILNRGIVYLGAISYGTYLVHEAVLQYLRNTGFLPPEGGAFGVIITTILVYLLSILIAIALYRLVEVPGQRFMGFYNPDGTLRNFYPHLEEVKVAAVPPPAAAPAAAAAAAPAPAAAAPAAWTAPASWPPPVARDLVQ